MSIAVLNGFALSGQDINGSLWSTREISGWWGRPAPSTTFTPRAQDDGDFASIAYLQGRTIVLSGRVMSIDRDRLDLSSRLLSSAALADPVALTIDGLTATVQASDVVLFTPDPGGKTAAWSVQLRATDPRKYGDQIDATTGLPAAGTGGLVFPLFDVSGLLAFGAPGVSGQVTLINEGTADAFLTFEITGPILGGWQARDVGSQRRIVYAGDVPESGTLLVVDSATGRATLNGADRTGEITVKQWWSVPAGGSSTVQFSTLGVAGQTGTCRALLSPAYW